MANLYSTSFFYSFWSDPYMLSQFILAGVYVHFEFFLAGRKFFFSAGTYVIFKFLMADSYVLLEFV